MHGRELAQVTMVPLVLEYDIVKKLSIISAGLMLALMFFASQVIAGVTYGIYALPDGWYQIRAKSTVAYVGNPQNQIGSCQVTIKYPSNTANIVNLTSDQPMIIDWTQGPTTSTQTDDPGWTYISFGTTGGTLDFPANTEVNLFRFLNLTPCENIIGLIDHTTDNYYLNSIRPGGNSVGTNPGNNFFQLISGEVYTGNHKPTATCYNQPPKALDDINSTLINTPVNGQVLTNDSDPDGDPLVVTTTPVAAPTHGTVVLNSDGTYTYTPATGYIGQDQFTYQMCDQVGPHTDQYCQTADVIIQVLQNDLTRNDPPAANDDVYETLVNTPINGNVVVNDLDPDKNPLTVATTPVVTPAHGSVTLYSDGTFTYTPVTGYIGDDSFTYSVCDNGSPALCDQAVVHITVYPDDNGTDNDPPFAADDAFITELDHAINGTVAPNDRDPNGHPLVFSTTPVKAPVHGTLTIAANGTFVYTPMTGYTGPDHFVYQVCDNQAPALCDVATAYIVVEPATNLPPIAVDDINNTIINIPVSGNVLTNDKDPANDPLTVNTTPVTAPVHGAVVLNADGSYTYTPSAYYVGDDYFDYQVCDNGSPALCDVGRVYIRITQRTPDNDPPVANADARETLVNKPVTGSLLANDFDPDGNNLVINTAPVAAPSHGTVVINSNGSFVYTPATGYIGSDLFIYRICDDGSPSLCATAPVTIQVYPDENGPANDPPIAADDAYGIRAEKVLTGSLALNDSDPNGDLLTYTTTPLSGPSHGTLTINSNGTFSYTPAADYVGPDQFIYRVCDNLGACDIATAYITVFQANQPPQAVDDINDTAINIPVSGNVMTNDSDPDEDDITVTTPLLILPVNGSIVFQNDGDYTYTPNLNFTGVDSFKYQICDNGDPVKCDVAFCYIYVIEDSYGNNPPIANNDAMETLVNVSINGNVLSNDDDPDGDALIVTKTPLKAPLHGTVTLNVDGTFVYKPATNYVGRDKFIYRVCDTGSPSYCTSAVVTINIYPVQQSLPNDPPFAADDAFITWINTAVSGSVALNDNDPNGNSLIYETTPVSGPSHGTVTMNGSGGFTYTPVANYIGPDQFVYMVCDDGEPGLCDLGTVYLTVIPPPAPNNAPVAIDDINNTLINTPVSGQVLTNDSDPDGHTLTVTTTPVVVPLHGSVVLNGNGSYTYTPATGYLGLDSFDYQVCDDGLPPLCSTATVWIQVVQDGAGNTAPVANNDAIQTLVNVPVGGNVLNNDDDPDGDPLTVNTTPATPPGHGSLTLNADGSFVYTPETGYVGEDLFVYQVCDNGTPALCSTASVIISVLPDRNGPDNDPPLAADDACITLMNNAVSGSVAPNDKDPNGNPLTFNTTPVSGPSHGTVTLQANGSFVYTPTDSYIGPDRFIYQVCDNGGLCDQATVYITVLPITRVRLQLKVLLQGPFDTSAQLMKDNLRSLGLLPTAEPYTSMTGFVHAGPGGGETVNPAVFAATGANAIVDWIFVELRNPASMTTVVATRSALLQRDGDVVDLDGLTALTFEETGAASYFVAVRHRNHFGTVTAAPIALTNVPTVVNFTSPATPTYGTWAQKEVIAGSVLALWMGNVYYSDRRIIFQGPGNDSNPILAAVFADPGNISLIRNYILRGYNLGDVDLSGQAIYQGPGNDANKIFDNVLNYPGNTHYLRNFIMNEQLP